jgi:hypothetical protein
MTCDELDARLDEFVDGTLDAAAAQEVRAHLAACSACRESERRLRELLVHAAALARSVEPPRDLWPGIASRIERSSGGWRLAWGMAALAAALVIGVAMWTALRPGRGSVHTVEIPAGSSGPATGVRQASAGLDPALLAAERDYERAASALLAALEERRAGLSPETLAVVERNLAVIDKALAEVRQALEADPANPELNRMLVATHRKKVDVLRRVVSLSTAL